MEKTRMYAAGSSPKPDLRSAGMTLLELLVVLVIASLMLALVAPNIGKVLPGAEIKGFALQSAALLREIRSEALVRAEPRTLGLAVEERRYRTNSAVSLSWPEGIEVALEVGDWPGKVAMDMDAPQLVFYPDGSSNGGHLLLSQAEGRQYRIQVDALTGRVKIDG